MGKNKSIYNFKILLHVILMNDVVYTGRGTPNVSLIKYWGKRDEELILPYNSSISMTLDWETQTVLGKQFKLFTKTSVIFSDRLSEDVIYMDGAKMDPKDPEAVECFKVINILRETAKKNSRVMIVTENTFPVASGLASSASCIATLVYTASVALDLKLDDKNLSIIARIGSGNACRSILGGIVKWEKGSSKDGSDSYSHVLHTLDYWPELLDLVVIVSQSAKKEDSRIGMANTVATSDLYKKRLEVVDGYITELEKALKEKDFDLLSKVVMKDSNNTHAVMLDTTPPILYLNDISRNIIEAINQINKDKGKNVCAYTFESGPNPHIITTEQYKEEVIDRLIKVEGMQSLISAKLGNGPILLGDSESLINKDNLQPIKH